MPTIMCTRSLWRAIGGRGMLADRSPDLARDTKLGAWSIRDVPTPSGDLVAGLEETTYLTVVCALAQHRAFIDVFASAVETALTDLGVASRVARAEASAIAARPAFAKNDNRSLLGSLNDVAFHVVAAVEDERRIDAFTLRRIQKQLNGMPHVHREPAFPDQAVTFLLGETRVV